MNPPRRGFSTTEFRARLCRAQQLMVENDLSALLLTTEADVRYFTGFLTRFWESPTRPWFLLVPAEGMPVAIIPEIGAHLMGASSWIEDIRTWASPDYDDDGVSLLAETIEDILPDGVALGVPSGGETHLRMPLTDWSRLNERLGTRVIRDDADILRALKMIKSEAEIEKIAYACAIAGRAFGRLQEVVTSAPDLATVFRRFQMLCLEEGADWVPYLAGAAGPDGYDDVISPANERPISHGDVLMLDTGLVRDGYFCDFNRNFSIGEISAAIRDAHVLLVRAAAAGFEAARPGTPASELFFAMDAVLKAGSGGMTSGRLGHGLGMQLTEPPSLMPQDQTILECGMVLTLEPIVELSGGKLLVHEENIVITENGPIWLSPPSIAEIPTLISTT